MHVKTFRGQTIAEVMEAVRGSLGPDAVILETRQPKGAGVEVRAAVESMPSRTIPAAKSGASIAVEADFERRLREDLLGAIRTETLRTRSARLKAKAAAPNLKDIPSPKAFDDRSDIDISGAKVGGDGWRRTGTLGIVKRRIRRPGSIDPAAVTDTVTPASRDLSRRDVDLIAASLEFHGVPKLLRDDLIHAARALDTNDAYGALACALDARFVFDPVPALPQRPVMLVGAPGAGKTVTAAKLAARAVLLGRGVEIISTDTLRAGAKEQMESFAGILKEQLICATSPEELEAILECSSHAVPRRPSFIDTPGTNPFSRDDLDDLRKFVRALDVEPIFVAAAGMDSDELTDAAQVFATFGVQRMITTRMDAARRLGGLLAAADGAKLNLAQFSMTPYIARGLSTLNPMSLARLFLDGPAGKTGNVERSRGQEGMLQ